MEKRHQEFDLHPRIYVVSDVRLHREGLISHLAASTHLEVLGTCSVAEASFEVKSKRPDVILLDVQAEGSLTLPGKLKASVPSLRVIGYAVCEFEAGILDCARAGMCGFVGKNAGVPEMIDAILRAMNGELTCSPRVAAMLFSELAMGLSVSFGKQGAVPLTSREKEIASLVAEGLANKEIARKLKLGNPTVKNHVHHILCKLNVARRSQIASLLRPRERFDPLIADDELSEMR